MVHKIFEDFLKNDEDYKACESYWQRLVQKIAEATGATQEWPRWIPRQYADGTPFELDGNPIFDGRSQRLSKAFRIIQHAPVGDELEIVAWLKHYEDEFIELPRDELVINLSLSEESGKLAEVLLEKWMASTTTPDEMRTFILEKLAPG